MSDFKDLYNPDFQKYGFSEFDFETPAEPAPAAPATDAPAPEADKTILSNLKTIFKKQKQ